MALINFPQAPTVSSVYAPKDSVAQLNYMNQSNVQGLSNLLNLGSKIHDYALSREQANLMEQPGGNEDQKMRDIAALESRKINASDPSMIWRWKAQMDQQAAEAEKNRLATKEANDALRQNDLANFGYKESMLLSRNMPQTPGEIRTLQTEIESAIIEGKKIGADTKALESSLEDLRERSGKLAFEQAYEEDEKKKIAENEAFKKREREFIEEELSRLEDLTDKDEYNAGIRQLKYEAGLSGIRSDVKWPDERKKSRTHRTGKEEDEFNALEALNQKGRLIYAEEIERYNKLKKLKPFKG